MLTSLRSRLPLLLFVGLLLLSACTSATEDPEAPVAGSPDPASAQAPTATRSALEFSELSRQATATLAAATATQAAASPTPTSSPTAPPLTPTPEPTATAAPPDDPAALNSIPFAEIALFTPEVEETVRQVFATGRRLGRDPHAFSKLGDSLIATPNFLTLFDAGPYDLGIYGGLQPVIDHYAGSYERYGVAVHAGLHSWGIFDPLWAPKDWCGANEDIVACELRLHNPSVLLILLGSNDAGSPGNFDYHIRKVAQVAMDQGVIPVLVTKADRFEGPDNTNNLLIRQAAADLNVLLWDFDRLAETLPGRGLTEDGIHLTPYPSGDYRLAEAFQSGHGLHNLSALVVLQRILEVTGQLEP